MWQKRMEKVQGKLPGFVELLNDQETLKLVGHEVNFYHPLVLLYIT